MITGNPEQDAQTFINRGVLIELCECDNCNEMVEAEQIKPETDNLCDDCKKLDFCICGEVLDDCLYCKPSKVDLFQKIRGFWIGLMQDFI